MDWTQFLQQFIGLKDAVAGVPIIFVVVALVQIAKNRWNLAGKDVELVSLGIGLLIGVGYRFGNGVEPTFAWWFGTVIYGLLLGIVPSQLYKTGTDVVKSAVQKSVQPAAGDVPPEVAHTPPEILEQFKNK